jgi:Sulfotransferase family
VTLPAGREVIFVGGTRFSGAEAVAGLLADHPAAVGVPVAARFHSDPWGIPALLHGRIGVEDFTARLRSSDIAGRIAGDRLDQGLAALRGRYDAEPLEACRELLWALFGDLAGDSGQALVEASPGNLVEAQTLMRLVPEARFVHVARDGRDVAAAAVGSDPGVSRIPAGLAWWAGEMREIEHGVRGEEDGSPFAIPPDRLAVVVLDELAGAGAAYAQLCNRVGLGEDGEGTAPVHRALDASAIGRGRWRTRSRGLARWWITRRYQRILDGLEDEGNHAAPLLRAAFERTG